MDKGDMTVPGAVILLALTLPAAAQTRDRAQMLDDLTDYLTKSGWNCGSVIGFVAVAPDHTGEVAKVTCEVTSVAGGASRTIDYRVSIPRDAFAPGKIEPWR